MALALAGRQLSQIALAHVIPGKRLAEPHDREMGQAARTGRASGYVMGSDDGPLPPKDGPPSQS